MHTLDVDLGIDQLFMEHSITVKTSHPGRMAPNTALCFLLSGVTGWFLGWRPLSSGWSLQTASLLCSVVFALGAVAFFGYVGGMSTAYGWGQLTRMAVHTSIGFVVLSTGMWLRPGSIDRRR